MITRWKVAAVVVGGCFALACLFGGDALGQRKEQDRANQISFQDKDDKDKEKGKEKGKELKRAYFGVAACQNKGCHGGDPPEKWIKNDKTGKDFDLLCRCDEKLQWEKHDKHAEAWLVLKGERGQRMAKILGYDVTMEKACLVCHSVWIDPKDTELVKDSDRRQFKKEEGVNCVVCHGPYTKWVPIHGNFLEAPDFRPLSREIKEKEWGMRNLWDPVKRTELCSSCHIGNWQEGKFVTHEMYAAGHPPLPGFEVTAFSDQMPKHWQYLRDKKPEIRKELGLREGEFEQTQLVLIGAAISLRDTMRLLIAQAKLAQKPVKESDKVLDLSNFDCYACHHGLKRDSWRQDRGYRGKPGRVPMRAWSTELIKLAIAHLKTAEGVDDKKMVSELEAGMKKLNKAFETGTVGDPTLIEKAATEVEEWTNKLADRLNKAFVTKKTAVALLGEIPKRFSTEMMDYDSARQVGWASEVLFKEAFDLEGKGDKDVKASLAAIDKELRLRLPQGRGKGKWIEDELHTNLEKINDYNPRTFQKLITDFGKSMKSK